uniref:Uncharacterized protein n=1 Tax=Oryza brachyantha TaxID=4533 RepID=J3MNJ9_ORYBR
MQLIFFFAFCVTCMHARNTYISSWIDLFLLSLEHRAPAAAWLGSPAAWSLLERGGGWLVEVVWRPEVVDGAGLPRVESQPWLPLAAPVEEADRARVEAPAPALHVVAAEPVLVPPVVHRLDVAGEHQQERRQRAEVVDPLLLLHRHPLLDAPRVPAAAPP